MRPELRLRRCEGRLFPFSISLLHPSSTEVCLFHDFLPILRVPFFFRISAGCNFYMDLEGTCPLFLVCSRLVVRPKRVGPFSSCARLYGNGVDPLFSVLSSCCFSPCGDFMRQEDTRNFSLSPHPFPLPPPLPPTLFSPLLLLPPTPFSSSSSAPSPSRLLWGLNTASPRQSTESLTPTLCHHSLLLTNHFCQLIEPTEPPWPI